MTPSACLPGTLHPQRRRAALLGVSVATFLLLTLLPASAPWQSLWGVLAGPRLSAVPLPSRQASPARGYGARDAPPTPRRATAGDGVAEEAAEGESPPASGRFLAVEVPSGLQTMASSMNSLRQALVATAPVPGGRVQRLRYVNPETSRQMFDAMLLIGLEGRSASSVCAQAEAILRDPNFSVTGVSEDLLRNFFASAAERAGEFTPSELARLLFNVAKVAQKDRDFAAAIGRWTPSIVDTLLGRLESEEVLSALSGTDAARVTSAMEGLRVRKDALLQALLQRLVPDAQGLQGPDVVRAVRSAARVDPGLLERLADSLASESVSSRLGAQTIANVLTTCAQAGVFPRPLFQRLGDRLAQPEVAARITSPYLARAMWAFAKAGFKHPVVTKVLVLQAQVESFWLDADEQTLSSVLWAMAALRVKDVPALKSITDRVVAPDIAKTISPQHMGNILWAYAQLGAPFAVLRTLSLRVRDPEF
eukprot:EG_transcript_10464